MNRGGLRLEEIICAGGILSVLPEYCVRRNLFGELMSGRFHKCNPTRKFYANPPVTFFYFFSTAKALSRKDEKSENTVL